MLLLRWLHAAKPEIWRSRRFGFLSAYKAEIEGAVGEQGDLCTPIISPGVFRMEASHGGGAPGDISMARVIQEQREPMLGQEQPQIPEPQQQAVTVGKRVGVEIGKGARDRTL